MLHWAERALGRGGAFRLRPPPHLEVPRGMALPGIFPCNVSGRRGTKLLAHSYFFHQGKPKGEYMFVFSRPPIALGRPEAQRNQLECLQEIDQTSSLGYQLANFLDGWTKILFGAFTSFVCLFLAVRPWNVLGNYLNNDCWA